MFFAVFAPFALFVMSRELSSVWSREAPDLRCELDFSVMTQSLRCEEDARSKSKDKDISY
jgi:hypothetical protein